ncbi:hypothetical protein D3C76_1805730 [compost metagenome]
MLELFTHPFQALDHLLLDHLQLFEQQLAAGNLLGQLKRGGVLRVGAKLVALLA